MDRRLHNRWREPQRVVRILLGIQSGRGHGSYLWHLHWTLCTKHSSFVSRALLQIYPSICIRIAHIIDINRAISISTTASARLRLHQRTSSALDRAWAISADIDIKPIELSLLFNLFWLQQLYRYGSSLSRAGKISVSKRHSFRIEIYNNRGNSKRIDIRFAYVMRYGQELELGVRNVKPNRNERNAGFCCPNPESLGL